MCGRNARVRRWNATGFQGASYAGFKSVASVSAKIDILNVMGYITYAPGAKRTLMLTIDGEAYLQGLT
jgi:hypothetical protein